MARPTTAAFDDVFGGVNLESGSELTNMEARELTNLYIRNKGQELQRRKGQVSIVSGYTGNENRVIDGLKWVRINGTDYLLSVIGGVYDGLQGGLSISGGPSRFTSGDPVNFAKVANKLYFGNGVDQNCRFDGTNVVQVMPSQPPISGFATSGVAGTGGPTGTYAYRVTYLSADGIDSQPSDASTTLVYATSASGVTITGIPTADATEDVTARRIWRNLNGGTTLYLVATVTGNVDTTAIDNTVDANVDTDVALDLQTVRFPPCRYLANFQERLAGGYCTTAEGDKHTLYVSVYQTPESCPNIAPLDEVDDPTFGIRIPFPDEITAMIAWGNVLLVWTRGACYRLIGDNPNNWSLDKWIDVGCLSHRSVSVYRNTLIWLGPNGVYLAENWGQVSRISEPIRTVFDAFTSAQMGACHGFVWDDRYYLVASGGTTYYFDLKFRIWGEVSPWSYALSSVSEDTGLLRERIFGASDTSTQLWEMETGTDDNGTTISVVWESKDRDLGLFGREKRVHRVVVHFKVGTGTATVELYRGGALIDTFSQDLSTVSRTGGEVSVLDDRASEGARDEFFRLRITAAAGGPDWRLLRAGWHYTLAT